MSPELARRFSFFSLVDLLERSFQPAAKVGFLGPATGEIVRFECDPSLAFPISEVVELQEITEEDKRKLAISGPRYRAVVAFMGLVGSMSPLPAFYTEDILQNDPTENAQRVFLDLFHHRLISLFYRAWLKYQYSFQFAQDCSDPISQRLLALMGLGSGEVLKVVPLRPVLLLRYASLFYSEPRSASALQTILRDFFRVPVCIKQCVPVWSDIEDWQKNTLGRQNCNLGRDIVLATRARNCVSTFRIIIGPVSHRCLRRFLPCERRFRELASIVGLFIKDRLDFNLEVLVLEETIPSLKLHALDSVGPRLGWTTFLGRTPALKSQAVRRTQKSVLLGRTARGERI